jgi:hypothetical protein
VAVVAAVVPDLLFGSKVKAMLEAEGHEVRLVAAPEQSGAADVMVVDLATGDVDAAAAVAAAGDARTLGFYSHVEADVKRDAEAAGFDLVVPRSRMAREGALLVGRLAGG